MYFYTFRQNGINKTCRHTNRFNANIQNSSIPIVNVWSFQTHHLVIWLLFMLSKVTFCFLIPWTINNRSIIIDNDKKRSRTHACMFSLFFFNYIPAIFHMCSHTHRYRSLTVDLEKNCHRCITSRIQFTHARRLLNDLQWATN